MRFIKPLFVFLLIASVFFSFSSKSVQAFFEDVLDEVQEFILPKEKDDTSLDIKIELTPEGDYDKNGEIDSGDIIKFTYTITNNTDKEYSFLTLKTNLNRPLLNFIHDVKGTLNLSDTAETIDISNLRLNPNQSLEISFNARVNYFDDKDQEIATEPELLNIDKQQLQKLGKKSISAKKLKENMKVPSNIEGKVVHESN